MLNANATRRESEDLTIFFWSASGSVLCGVSVCVVGVKVDWIGEKVEGFSSLYHIRDEVHTSLSVWEDGQAMGQCE